MQLAALLVLPLLQAANKNGSPPVLRASDKNFLATLSSTATSVFPGDHQPSPLATQKRTGTKLAPAQPRYDLKDTVSLATSDSLFGVFLQQHLPSSSSPAMDEVEKAKLLKAILNDNPQGISMDLALASKKTLWINEFFTVSGYSEAMTPLMIAVLLEKPKCFEFLLQLQPNLLAATSSTKTTALMLAFQSKNSAMIVGLCKRMTPSERGQADRHGRTALMIGCQNGISVHFLDMLWHEDIMPDCLATDVQKRTVLHYAIDSIADVSLVKYLVGRMSAGAILSAERRTGESVLIRFIKSASAKGSSAYLEHLVPVVQMMVKKSPRLVNQPDSLGLTPLHWACSLSQIEVAKALCSSGAEESITDNQNLFPIDYLKEPYKHRGLLQMLHDKLKDNYKQMIPSKIPDYLKYLYFHVKIRGNSKELPL